MAKKNIIVLSGVVLVNPNGVKPGWYKDHKTAMYVAVGYALGAALCLR